MLAPLHTAPWPLLHNIMHVTHAQCLTVTPADIFTAPLHVHFHNGPQKTQRMHSQCGEAQPRGKRRQHASVHTAAPPQTPACLLYNGKHKNSGHASSTHSAGYLPKHLPIHPTQHHSVLSTRVHGTLRPVLSHIHPTYSCTPVIT